ncbi:uncharacterized protein [Typha latifolia]|uniref:uncharacterized protein n=1 Tax=Typha latifolia TaxID=4733 RepID=UPI003C2B6EA0
MGFVGCTSRRRLLLLLLGLLLSIANANHVVGVASKNHDQSIVGVMNLGLREEAAVVATTRRRLLGGRKMSAVNVEKDEATEVKGSINTGKASNTLKKPEDSPSKKMDGKDSKTTKLKSSTIPKHPSRADLQTYHATTSSQGPFERINPHKYIDEATDMFNMMSKDYHAKARRRPPINNDVPLHDFDDEP